MIYADIENLAGGSDFVGVKSSELTLTLRTTKTSHRDKITWSAGKNARELAPTLQAEWEARNWRFVEPYQGVSGPDKSLVDDFFKNRDVLFAKHLVILGGDAEFLPTAEYAMDRGIDVTVVGLRNDTSKNFKKIGVNVVELSTLYGLKKLL
ncbi:MAG: hypothetical protein NTY27_00090 [Actinobacteria bacterium]|nr:hypothetical protein [Actinomycetota bacterium]